MTKENVNERVKKLKLVNVTKEQKLGITAVAKSRKNRKHRWPCRRANVSCCCKRLLVNITKEHVCICAKGDTAGSSTASNLLWPSVKHVVDSLLRTLRSSWNFITFGARYLFPSAYSFSQRVVATWTILMFTSLNGSVSMTRFRLLLGALRPWKIPPNVYHRAASKPRIPTNVYQIAPQLKRKFGNGIAVGLCLPGSRYGSPSLKMG